MAASSRQACERFKDGPRGVSEQAFVNDLALEALPSKRFPLPEGASTAKESYDAEGRLHNLAVVR